MLKQLLQAMRAGQEEAGSRHAAAEQPYGGGLTTPHTATIIFATHTRHTCCCRQPHYLGI